MAVIHGRNTQLLLQRESVFRTAPSAAAFQMKYSTLNLTRGQERIEDPTITARPLMARRDPGNVTPSARIRTVLDLNDIGQWLALLWGAPSTTGVGPYTHTYTLSLSDRPSALLELGYPGKSEYFRFLGAKLASLSWEAVSGDQSLDLDLIPAVEDASSPYSSAFDAAPTAYAANRACPKGANVADVIGASTLGQVASCTVQISNDLQPQLLADALDGYGAILLGQPAIAGTMRVLFEDAKSWDHARANTAKALKVVATSADGTDTLTLTVPEIDWDEPAHTIERGTALIHDLPWRGADNATAPTIVLVNDVATY